MKPATQVRIKDSILDVEVETIEYIPIDDVITKEEELLGRVNGKPIGEDDEN